MGKLIEFNSLVSMYPFKRNKYYSLYRNIGRRAILRQSLDEYPENHHFIPKHLNKSKNNPDGNGPTIRVTHNEHCLLHLLIIKMVESKEEYISAIYAFLCTVQPSISGRKTQKRAVLHRWHIWYDIYIRKLAGYGYSYYPYKQIIKPRNNEGFTTHAEIGVLLINNSNNVERRIKSPPQPKIDALPIPIITVERRMKVSSKPRIDPLPVPSDYR